VGPSWELGPEDPWPRDFIARLKTCFEQNGPEFVITFSGPLGAGKTTRIQQLAADLGLNSADFTSPTFLKLIEHRHGASRILHLDLYRVDDSAELQRWGLGEEPAALTLVEWPELFFEAWRSSPHWKWDEHWHFELSGAHGGRLERRRLSQ
jgi:tRNA threonylcarbamoyladenosine biosynthesis protein TsaE